MLKTKLNAANETAVQEIRPNEKDLQEASEITGIPIENIRVVSRYGHIGPICDVYLIKPLQIEIDDEPVLVVSIIVSKGGAVVGLKDIGGKKHEVWGRL